MSEEKKPEIYNWPEIGVDGKPTGRTIVHERGSLSKKWNAIKAAADTPDEKRQILDIEFKNLKKKMVKFNKDKGAFTDGYGEVFTGPMINKKNNYVKAAANLLTDDVKLINKLINTSGWDWKSQLDEELEKDDANDPNYWAEDLIDKTEELKKSKAKKVLETLKTKPLTPIKAEVKTENIVQTLSRSEEIKRYLESLPQPSVEQIIKNRIKIKNKYSGIGSLKFTEPEFELEQPKSTSTGLNYLSGLDDEIT